MLKNALHAVEKGEFVLVDSAFGQRRVREEFLLALRSANPQLPLFFIYCHSDEVGKLNERLLFRNSDPCRTEAAGFNMTEVMRLRKEYEPPFDDRVGSYHIPIIEFDSDTFAAKVHVDQVQSKIAQPLVALLTRIITVAKSLQNGVSPWTTAGTAA